MVWIRDTGFRKKYPGSSGQKTTGLRTRHRNTESFNDLQLLDLCIMVLYLSIPQISGGALDLI
jgi:hypothetical protein